MFSGTDKFTHLFLGVSYQGSASGLGLGAYEQRDMSEATAVYGSGSNSPLRANYMWTRKKVIEVAGVRMMMRIVKVKSERELLIDTSSQRYYFHSFTPLVERQHFLDQGKS